MGRRGTTPPPTGRSVRRSSTPPPVSRRRRRAPTRALIAHHEAGHGVASYYLGFTLNVVSIHARDGSLGHMSDDPTFAADYVNDRVKSPQEISEAAAVVCYAGLAAEAHFGFARFTWRRRADHGAWVDDRLAKDYLAQIFTSRSELRLAVARCRRRAVRLIVDREADVRKVAKALLEVATLTEAEIEAVLEVPSVAAAVGRDSLASRRAALVPARTRRRSR